jgi:S1-C subfamily serine protease
MKSNYQITAKQLVVLALVTAIFAATAVLIYDRVGSRLLGRLAGARPEKTTVETTKVEGLTDPSVATDEKNNKEVYDAVSPGVVNITSTVIVQDWIYAYPQKAGSGSGSIVDKEGRVLTNFHVIQDARELEVTLPNKKSYPAKVLGADPDNDLAVIKIDAPASELTPVALGESDKLFVGQKVLAIGNPFGLDRTLTTGVISGLARPLKSEITGRLIEGVIQTDAAINPGNSGGPLLNANGQMVGINTMIYSPSGGSVGIGFAVPVKTAKRIINDILQYGRVRKPSLDLTSLELTPRASRLLEVPVSEGLLVQEAFPGGAAAKAGIRGGEPARYGEYIIYLGGDIIVGADGQPIRKRDDLEHILNNKNVGDSLNLEVLRGKQRLKLTVQLTESTRRARQRI